ncbi:hypothetical protein NUW58_g3915 [Xylaria curta]|uniref:Uncharacterized protein n=1 Tax=Xylaria curta TaxID=42375 RepID=A0ACC1PBH1_9PEZI|nr:hypothetical protein NUW58_g3915 [Xylaria curta]
MASNRVGQAYRLLSPGDDDAIAKQPVYRAYDERKRFPKWGALSRVTIFTIALVVSLSIAGSFAVGFLFGVNKSHSALSPYMKLSYDQNETLLWNTGYSDEKATEAELSQLWDTQIPWESGIIALDNDEAREMDLPESQPFPWDASKKSLYINAISSDYKLASSIKSKVPHYDLSSVSLSDSGIVGQLQDEWYYVLSRGPGVLILQNYVVDQALLEKINSAFDTIIEREATSAKGDHFAASGANSRIWNSFQKHAMQDPESFVPYFANPWLAKVTPGRTQRLPSRVPK